MFLTSLNLCPCMYKDKHETIQTRNIARHFRGFFASLKMWIQKDTFWGTWSIFKQMFPIFANILKPEALKIWGKNVKYVAKIHKLCPQILKLYFSSKWQSVSITIRTLTLHIDSRMKSVRSLLDGGSPQPSQGSAREPASWGSRLS